MKRLLWSMAFAVLCTFAVRADDMDMDIDVDDVVELAMPVSEPKPVEQARVEAPVKEEPIGLPITIPYLGTVTLIPFTKDAVSGLRAQLPATAKKLELGPLVIDDGWLSQLGDKFFYTAQAKLFGQAARIGFADVVDLKRLPLTISFEPVKPSFELFPGAKFELSSATLILEKDKPLQLVAATTLFGQPAEVTFVISQATKTTDVIIGLKDVPLKSMFPQVAGTPLENSAIKSISLTTTNLVNPDKTKKLEVLFTGIANLTGLPAEAASAQEKESKLTGRYDSKGSFLQLDVPHLALPGVGSVKEGKLKIDLQKANPRVEISGVSDLDIAGLAKLNTTLQAVMTKKGVEELSGTIDNLVSYAGITISEAKVIISPKDGTKTIRGNADIAGQKVTISMVQDAQNRLSVQGEVVDGKLIKPFAVLNIPGVSDIGLLPTGLKLQKTDKGSEIISTGKVELFGANLDGELRMKNNVKLLVINGRADWRLSDIVRLPGSKPLQGTFFDNLALSHMQFVVCSDNYSGDFIDDRGAVIQVDLKRGMNFVAKIKLTGALAPVASLTGVSESIDLTVIGKWSTSPFDFVLGAIIPGTMKLDPSFEVGKLKLEMAIGAQSLPSMALVTNIITTSAGDKLEFAVRVAIESGPPPKAALAGTMMGIWDKPFGISGLQIGNVAIQADFLIPPAAPPLPGMTGSICIGGQMATGDPRCTRATAAPAGEPLCKDGFGACAAIKIPDLVSGEVDKLSIADIIKMAATLIGQKLDASKLPEIGFKEVKIYIVPKATSIGEFKFEKGFNVTGKVDILGVHAFLGVSILASDVMNSGVIMKGSIEPIDFQGLLKVTGKGGKGKAQVDVEITLKRQQFLIDGEIALANFFKSGSKIEVSKNGLMFDFESSMGDAVYTDPATQKKLPLLLAQVTGRSSGGLTNPQFMIEIIFKQYLKKYITEQTVNGLRVAEKAVDEALSSAQREIDKINSATREVNAKMKDARDKLESAKRALESIQGAKKKVTDAMASAQRDVDSIRGEITSLDRWYNGLPNVC